MTIENIIAFIQETIDKAYEYRAEAQAFEAYSVDREVLTQLAEQEFKVASGMISGYIMFAPHYDPKVLNWWSKTMKEWYTV